MFSYWTRNLPRTVSPQPLHQATLIPSRLRGWELNSDIKYFFVERQTSNFKRQKMRMRKRTSKATNNSKSGNIMLWKPLVTEEQVQLKRDTERVYSQANASWGSQTPGKRKQLSKSSLRNDYKDIQDLLDLLKTTDFAGTIDPQHHSDYFQPPESEIWSQVHVRGPSFEEKKKGIF